MAKKKKQQKRKRKKSHKGHGVFSNNAYNNFVYDHFKYGRNKRQRRGFLNRYDFAYAGKDTVNQASKQLNALGPKLVEQLTTGLDKVSANRVKQLEQMAPGLIKGAVEELYKTPFRLLEKAGKKKYDSIKKNVSNKLKRLKI